MAEKQCDVFISGAGPSGLVLTYQLHRLGIDVYTVDQIDRTSPENTAAGAASSLLPRTLEMLDQLDLFGGLAQVGFVSRKSAAYNSNGEKITNSFWKYEVENIQDTFFDYNLNIRQRNIENVFREGLAKVGAKVHARSKLVDFTIDESDKEYPVKATCTDPSGGQYIVRAKYIVGCDGGHSMVRKASNINFIGEHTENHWVRVDGIIKTDMPDARIGNINVESKTHGSVLWVALDHRATRVGFALTGELFKKYGRHMKEEDAVKEAKRCVEPFKLEFEQVDWHTVYTVQQRVVERLYDRGRVFLAGDAAHTHSSGGAQGLNTGMHDVVTLSWRLAGVVKGWYSPKVFQSYNDERHATAWKLITMDQDMSSLISGQKPAHLASSPKEPIALLADLMKNDASFILGLGVQYAPSFLNRSDSLPTNVEPGQRAPDVLIHEPGYDHVPSRLYHVMKNNGKFKVLLFCGLVLAQNPLGTAEYKAKSDAWPKDTYDVIEVIAGTGPQPDEYLGFGKMGFTVWDVDHGAHDRYGVSTELGGVLVVRPDGILGFAAPMSPAGFEKVGEYLKSIVA